MWIRHIPYSESAGRLRELYDRVKGPDDNVDNIMLAHSLRPHTMEGHMALYKATLHHVRNTIPRWFLEALGVFISLLNRCDYCVEHHFTGMSRHLGDDVKAHELRAALENGKFEPTFSEKETRAILYAQALTRDPSSITASDLTELRAAGWCDDEILEINQVTAYFNYANRTVLGLGVETSGDVLGLSPNNAENPEDWSHQDVPEASD